MFSSRNFMVSCLIFKSLSLFLCMLWQRVLTPLIYMWLSNFPDTTWWKDFFPILYSCLLCQRLMTLGVWVNFWVLYSVPLIHVNITFICTGEKKKKTHVTFCDLFFTVVVWNIICNILEVGLYIDPTYYLSIKLLKDT